VAVPAYLVPACLVTAVMLVTPVSPPTSGLVAPAVSQSHFSSRSRSGSVSASVSLSVYSTMRQAEPGVSFTALPADTACQDPNPPSPEPSPSPGASPSWSPEPCYLVVDDPQLRGDLGDLRSVLVFAFGLLIFFSAATFVVSIRRGK
jgi:hypothetical protein